METGYQDPDMRNGDVDIAGCVSGSSSHLQSISPGALKKWAIWSLAIKNACLRADGMYRVVCERAPCEWDSKNSRRVWTLRAPAYGLNDAQVAIHRPLREYLVNPVESFSGVGLRFGASSFAPRLFYVGR